MTIIFFPLLLCLFLAFWYSETGRKSGLTGEEGWIAFFSWRAYFRVKNFFAWFFDSPGNLWIGAWGLFMLAFYVLFSLATFQTTNPFKIYKSLVVGKIVHEHSACLRRLHAAQDAGDTQKIQEALMLCEKNPDYNKAKNLSAFYISQYKSCQKDLAAARATNDLRKARRIYESCAENHHFIRAKGYPNFDVEKYMACREETRIQLGVARLKGSDDRMAADFCFKKHRGPLADAHWLMPKTAVPD